MESSHLDAVAQLGAELDSEELADVRLRSDLEAREQRRRLARELAEREAAEAAAEEEGRALERQLAETGEELRTLGRVVRAAFDAIGRELPRLLAAQKRVDAMVKRAAALGAQGVRVHVSKRMARLGGLDRKALEVVDYAVKAQSVADG